MLPQLGLCFLPAAAATSSAQSRTELQQHQWSEHLNICCAGELFSRWAVCYGSVDMLVVVKMSWSSGCLLWSTWISTCCILVIVWDALHVYIIGKGSSGCIHYILAEFLYDSWEKWEGGELLGLKDLISLRLRRLKHTERHTEWFQGQPDHLEALTFGICYLSFQFTNEVYM